MIQSGEGVEHYEEWAHNGDLSVKCELAKHGYFPEYFLQDNTPYVTTYALKAHPEYLPKLIESTKDHQIWAVHEILIDKRDVTEDELLTVLSIHASLFPRSFARCLKIVSDCSVGSGFK